MTIPSVTGGRVTSYEDVRTLSYYDFAALQTLGLPIGPVRLLAWRRASDWPSVTSPRSSWRCGRARRA